MALTIYLSTKRCTIVIEPTLTKADAIQDLLAKRRAGRLIIRGVHTSDETRFTVQLTRELDHPHSSAITPLTLYHLFVLLSQDATIRALLPEPYRDATIKPIVRLNFIQYAGKTKGISVDYAITFPDKPVYIVFRGFIDSEHLARLGDSFELVGQSLLQQATQLSPPNGYQALTSADFTMQLPHKQTKSLWTFDFDHTLIDNSKHGALSSVVNPDLLFFLYYLQACNLPYSIISHRSPAETLRKLIPDAMLDLDHSFINITPERLQRSFFSSGVKHLRALGLEPEIILPQRGLLFSHINDGLSELTEFEEGITRDVERAKEEESLENLFSNTLPDKSRQLALKELDDLGKIDGEKFDGKLLQCQHIASQSRGENHCVFHIDDDDKVVGAIQQSTFQSDPFAGCFFWVDDTASDPTDYQFIAKQLAGITGFTEIVKQLLHREDFSHNLNLNFACFFFLLRIRDDENYTIASKKKWLQRFWELYYPVLTKEQTTLAIELLCLQYSPTDVYDIIAEEGFRPEEFNTFMPLTLSTDKRSHVLGRSVSFRPPQLLSRLFFSENDIKQKRHGSLRFEVNCDERIEIVKNTQNLQPAEYCATMLALIADSDPADLVALYDPAYFATVITSASTYLSALEQADDTWTEQQYYDALKDCVTQHAIVTIYACLSPTVSQVKLSDTPTTLINTLEKHIPRWLDLVCEEVITSTPMMIDNTHRILAEWLIPLFQASSDEESKQRLLRLVQTSHDTLNAKLQEFHEHVTTMLSATTPNEDYTYVLAILQRLDNVNTYIGEYCKLPGRYQMFADVVLSSLQSIVASHERLQRLSNAQRSQLPGNTISTITHFISLLTTEQHSQLANAKLASFTNLLPTPRSRRRHLATLDFDRKFPMQLFKPKPHPAKDEENLRHSAHLSRRLSYLGPNTTRTACTPNFLERNSLKPPTQSGSPMFHLLPRRTTKRRSTVSQSSGSPTSKPFCFERP